MNHADATACTNAGCTWETPCAAMVNDCSTLQAAAACNLQQGCEWNASAGACEADPSATACSELLDRTSCVSATGCGWTESDMTCRGTATPCDQLSAEHCTDQAGCSVQ